MKHLFPLFLISLLLIGCVSSPPEKKDVQDSSPPHTVDDISRRFPSPFLQVVDACKQAFLDVGADYFGPEVKIEENSAAITGSTKTCLYGVIILGYDDYTDVMLILDDKSTKEVLRKSVFDEFWAAVESHL